MCKHAASHITEGLLRSGLLPASHCKVSAPRMSRRCLRKQSLVVGRCRGTLGLRMATSSTVAILAQGTHRAVATSQAFCHITIYWQRVFSAGGERKRMTKTVDRKRPRRKVKRKRRNRGSEAAAAAAEEENRGSGGGRGGRGSGRGRTVDRKRPRRKRKKRREKLAAPEGVPRQSPTLVLTRPCAA